MTQLDASSSMAIRSVDTSAFKHAMRHLAGAVSVVTVGLGAERTGFTATSVASLSIDPPSLLVSLNRASSSWPVLRRRGSFAVNLLTQEQAHIADRFSGRTGVKGVERYAGSQWTELTSGTSVLANALAVLDCQVDDAFERHSHAIVVGRISAIAIGQPLMPLMYWQGAYRQIATLASLLEAPIA